MPVSGVLCFVDADWGFFPDPSNVNGAQVMWPKKLAGMLANSGGPMIDVEAIARTIARVYPPA